MYLYVNATTYTSKFLIINTYTLFRNEFLLLTFL